MEPLTDEQIAYFRDSLLQLREELRQSLAMSASAADSVALDQSRVGRLSRMDAMQQQQMQRATRSACQQRLRAVEHALTLMAEGEYGWCERCGEEIDPRRLQVRPESALCLACQGLSESG